MDNDRSLTEFEVQVLSWGPSFIPYPLLENRQYGIFVRT